MQDESGIKWQYAAKENQLVLKQLKNMIKLYVHYGCFMLMQLHKSLITKRGYSFCSISELGWTQHEVSVGQIPKLDSLQVGGTWQSSLHPLLLGQGRREPDQCQTSPWILGNKAAIPRFCDKPDCSPTAGFPFSVCSWGMQCFCCPYPPGLFP